MGFDVKKPPIFRPRLSQRGSEAEEQLLEMPTATMKLDFIQKVRKERLAKVASASASAAAAGAATVSAAAVTPAEQQQFLDGVLSFQQQWWEMKWNSRYVTFTTKPLLYHHYLKGRDVVVTNK